MKSPKLSMKIINILLFCVWVGLQTPHVFAAVPEHSEDFNWEDYFARLEGLRLARTIPAMFINQMGNVYLGTEGIRYDNDPAASVEILSYGINDDIREIRKRALMNAVAGEYQELVPSIIDRLRVEQNKDVKKLLVWAAGKLGDERVVLPLTQFLREEEDQDIIAFLALALGRVGGTGDEIGPLLYLAETSQNLLVKCSAILGIGRLKIDQGEPLLWDLTKYHAHEVRFTSILSLTFLNYDEDTKRDEILDIYRNDGSLYVKLGCAFHLLKRYGYNATYAQFISNHLNDIYHRAVVLDFMQDLAYTTFVYKLEREINAAQNRHVQAVYSRVLETILSKYEQNRETL